MKIETINQNDIYGALQENELNTYLDLDTISFIQYFNIKLNIILKFIKTNNLNEARKLLNQIILERDEFKNEDKLILSLINSTLYPLESYYFSKYKNIESAKDVFNLIKNRTTKQV